MKLIDFIWMPYGDTGDDYRNQISKEAIEENWGGTDFSYLRQYLADNFEIAYTQGKVKVSGNGAYCLFRVGALTNQEGHPITVLGNKNRLAGKQPFVFAKVFSRERFPVRVGGEEFQEVAPEAPSYEPPPYNRDFTLVYNFDHYLEDHETRVSEKLPNLTSRQKFLCLWAAMQLAHKRAQSCAVPQWYCDKRQAEGSYQWLLPLYINNESLDAKPDFVATLEPNEEYKEYNIRTVLPPEWAYAHARAVSGRDPHFRNWA
jgi:hypothetical protein